jgi:hypothetical protein
MREKSIFDPDSDRKYPGGGLFGIDPARRQTQIPNDLIDGVVEPEGDETEPTCQDKPGENPENPLCDLAEAKDAVEEEKERDRIVHREPHPDI